MHIYIYNFPKVWFPKRRYGFKRICEISVNFVLTVKKVDCVAFCLLSLICLRVSSGWVGASGSRDDSLKYLIIYVLKRLKNREV